MKNLILTSLAALLLSSCSLLLTPRANIDRIAARHPELCTEDTLHAKISFTTKEVKFDSTMAAKDSTFIIDKPRFKTTVKKKKDGSQEVSTEIKPQTFDTTATIKYKKIVTNPPQKKGLIYKLLHMPTWAFLLIAGVIAAIIKFWKPLMKLIWPL